MSGLAPIVVVGGGIAGLATALGLWARGVPCVVAESAREIVPLGVGINLLPHGVRVLTELGLAEALAEVSVETRAIEYRSRDGRLIHSDPRGRHAGMAFPQLSVHRGNLHTVLYGALLDRHGDDAIRPGLRLRSVERRGGFVHACFEDRRHGGEVRLDTEGLIGADGVMSSVRAAMRPGEPPPRGSGIVMYRGLTWARPMLDGRTMVIAGVHEHKAVLYPVRPPRRDGLQLINWVAEHGERFGGDTTAGDWNRPVDRAEVAALFADCRFDFADVPALVRAAEVCLSYPMVDRDPVDSWVDGRVALIGDAAHPMYPIGANGSSQALLDAEAIAECVAASPRDLPAGFAAFQARRLETVNAVVLANRARGPEKLLQLADERLAAGAPADGEPILSGETIDTVTSAYRRTAGFERESLASMSARPRLWPPTRSDATPRPGP
ncbi:MAG: FAD-dependent monooxygenase [Burkholderiales bacterium]|nr:FAD-dependent monooxygenase [Burkholderiales bacterium]